MSDLTVDWTAIPFRTPACDDHLEQNESDECPWCQIERLRAVLDVQEKFAWLCYQDYGFWGNSGNDVPGMALLLNDIFVSGADAMPLTSKQVCEVYAIAKSGNPEDVWAWAKAALKGDK